jgi:hypothetical protein
VVSVKDMFLMRAKSTGMTWVFAGRYWKGRWCPGRRRKV